MIIGNISQSSSIMIGETLGSSNIWGQHWIIDDSWISPTLTIGYHDSWIMIFFRDGRPFPQRAPSLGTGLGRDDYVVAESERQFVGSSWSGDDV